MKKAVIAWKKTAENLAPIKRFTKCDNPKIKLEVKIAKQAPFLVLAYLKAKRFAKIPRNKTSSMNADVKIVRTPVAISKKEAKSCFCWIKLIILKNKKINIKTNVKKVALIELLKLLMLLFKIKENLKKTTITTKIKSCNMHFKKGKKLFLVGLKSKLKFAKIENVKDTIK